MLRRYEAQSWRASSIFEGFLRAVWSKISRLLDRHALLSIATNLSDSCLRCTERRRQLGAPQWPETQRPRLRGGS